MTIDDGVAPCAPPALGTRLGFLTLAICKPEIRRLSRVGDWIVGISGKTLQNQQGYPVHAVVWAGIVAEILTGQEYYTLANRNRLDCIYSYDELTKLLTLLHTKIHDETNKATDIGEEPDYENATILICHDFRYFGKNAQAIPKSMPRLRSKCKRLVRWTDVYQKDGSEWPEIDALFEYLWEEDKPSTYAPASLPADSPRLRKPRKSAGTLLPNQDLPVAVDPPQSSEDSAAFIDPPQRRRKAC